MSGLKELYIVGARDFGRETAWLVGRITEMNSGCRDVGFLAA